MSASVLLSKTPVPRVLSNIYDPQGGGSGVTSAVAGDGISVSSATGAVTFSQATPTTDYGTAVPQVVCAPAATIPPLGADIWTSDLTTPGANAVGGLWSLQCDIVNTTAFTLPPAQSGGFQVTFVVNGVNTTAQSQYYLDTTTPNSTVTWPCGAVFEIPAGDDVTIRVGGTGTAPTSTGGCALQNIRLKRVSWE